MKIKYIIRSHSVSTYDKSYYAGDDGGDNIDMWDEASCAQRFNSENDALMIAAHKIGDYWHPLEIKKIYEKS